MAKAGAPPSHYAGRRVVVTGASGFVGSHMTRLLVRWGAQVAAVGVGVSWSRIDDLGDCVKRVAVDLTQANRAAQTIASLRPEVVFHLAAYAVQARERDVQTAIAVNVAGSAAVVEGAARGGAKLMVQVGTAHEYGGDGRAISEEHPLNPAGIYGATKAAAMLVGRVRARELGVRWLGVRPFVTFGPGEDEHKLLPYVIIRGLRGEAVDVSSGEQVRDYLYVEDLVEAIAMLAASDVDDGAVVNVASGVGLRVREVVEAAARAVGRADLRFGSRPLRPDDVLVQVADVSLLRKLLPSWRARHTLDQAMAETVAYYRKRMETTRL